MATMKAEDAGRALDPCQGKLHNWVVRTARGHDEAHCGRCMRCAPSLTTLLAAYDAQEYRRLTRKQPSQPHAAAAERGEGDE